MITYIVTETRENYERDGRQAAKIRLETLSGQPVLVIYFAQVTLDLLHRVGTRAVVFGGYGTPISSLPLEHFAGVWDLVRHGDLPILGLCGGHQLIAELWAPHNDAGLTRVGTEFIRPLRADEPDLNPDYRPGQFKEWGFYPIQIVQDDPLFEGVPNPFMACERHSREIKELPAHFELLASTAEVPIQAYRHREKLIYGTQFHCENWTDAYPAGQRILENFFRLAGVGG